MGNLTSVSNLQRLISATRPSPAHPELSILTTGQIPESTKLSGLIFAANTNHVWLLSFLLKTGASINTRDREENTLLHIAVLNNSQNVFKFLIKRNDVELDAVNCMQISALTVAVLSDKIYYVEKLIKKGANVNLRDGAGCIPLHHASQFSSLAVCQILIEAGSDINAQSLAGKTPFYVACQRGNADIIHMLLYYGADTSTGCHDGTLPLMVDKFRSLDLQLKLILYHCTFDEIGCTIELKTLTKAITMKWPLFEQILTKVSTVVYDTDQLHNLNNVLPDVKPENLILLWNKFDYILRDMVLSCCTLTNYLTAVEKMRCVGPDFLSFLEFLFENEFVQEVVQNCCTSVSPISSLAKIFHKNKLPLKTLTELVCCLLSYGANVTPSDLNAVYVFYGRCELFDIMLHMDIQTPKEFIPCCAIYDHEVIQQSIMPYFIYDVNLNIDKFLQNPQSYLLMDLDVLLDFFALPRLQDFFLADGTASDKVMKKMEILPSVPSLVELSRNVAREHIINTFGIKTSSQFYTAIKKLPVNNIYKRIISFEQRLYCT
ncbi:uncharacterized protein LOC135131129 [Zophobas morio]|uniref:uncharacterized protein LOC135131129 n=1 Tax=Zophobas morio TaxID=2755281 RepID=UPI00308308D7